MKPKNRVLAGLSALAIASTSSGAFAQQVEAVPDLTLVEIVQKLESLGYTKVDDLERDDGVWEAEATAPNGTRVELELDRKDGRILKETRDDDDDEDDDRG